MATQRYNVNNNSVEAILSWVKSGEIAIPEIQRPFVWDGSKIRDLLTSLYQGFPIGYLISWRNPNIKLKDGTSASGKRILIDGQQRVTALMVALLGQEVLNKDYETTRYQIAFNPQTEVFEVWNPAIQKNTAWIPDVATVFRPETYLVELVRDYCVANTGVEERTISKVIEKLTKIVNNVIGMIDLADDLDIETVTNIFILVNKAGVELSQADFAMSKIAANETYQGNLLRKVIDYFCHVAAHPDAFDRITKHDKAFNESEFYNRVKWVKDADDYIYMPSYTDMLRVAFTHKFRRGRLQDLVALLSGRNFETRTYEETIAEESFAMLRDGINGFISQTHFKRFSTIIRSAGFITSKLIGGQNALNVAYIVYLLGRDTELPAAQLESLVRKWYVFSVLTGRYSGNPESNIDYDIRRFESVGLAEFIETSIASELSESYWRSLLPQELETSSGNSPLFHVYQASQVKARDLGFLSSHISVADLLLNRTDVHHVYPRDPLKKQGLSRGQYNQIANLVLAQSEINISIGNQLPEVYFGHLKSQVAGGPLKYGAIRTEDALLANLRQHCVPDELLYDRMNYFEYLVARRHLMAAKLRDYFYSLGNETPQVDSIEEEELYV